MTFKNFWAHRRQNGFVFAEITLIAVLSFYFIDHITVTTYDRYFCRPAGDFEREHLVVGQVGLTPSPLPLKGEDGHLPEAEYDSQQNIPLSPSEEERGEGLSTLYALRDQIRALPEVQSVHLAVGFIGDEYMYYVSIFSSEADSSRRCGAREGWFLTNEHFFETQGLTPIEGSPSAEELSRCPNDGVVVTRSVARALFGTDQATGRRMVEWNFSDRALQAGGPQIMNRYTIAGVVEDFRFTPYERHAYSILTPRPTPVDLTPKVLIRLKPEADAEAFVNRYNAAPHIPPAGGTQSDESPAAKDTLRRETTGSLLRSGNHFLAGLITYNDFLAQKAPTEDSGMIATLLGILLALFLLNVVLGSLGTCWLQLRKRTEDIGIMRSFGAKRRDIFWMIWKEAALLTILASILGQLIWFQFAINIDLSDGLSMTYASYMPKDWVDIFWLHYIVICAVQFLILLAVVTLGIVVPAWRACRKRPVDALQHL